MSEAEGRAAEADRPAAAFRTISEAADELDLPQHVLRFWETRFSSIRPLKRGGGRRYYRKEDVDLLRGIKHLLYGQGYTIKGVQRILKSQGVKFVQNIAGNPGSLKAIADTPPESLEPSLGLPRSDRQVVSDPGHASVMSESGAAVASPATTTQATGFVYRAEAVSPKLSEDGRRRLRAALSELMEAQRLLLQPRPHASLGMAEDLDGG